MSYKSKKMKKIDQWGQIDLVCPCGGAPDKPYDFEFITEFRQVYYRCTNPECKNRFPADLHLKAMDLMNKYIEEHNTLEGFSAYFRMHDESIRLRYIETVKIEDFYEYHRIECSNLTRCPEFKDNRMKKISLQSVKKDGQVPEDYAEKVDSSHQ